MPLPGSERYRHKDWGEPAQPKSAVTKDIERANTVPMHRILREHFNLSVPSDLGEGSWKTRCPFAWEHSDGGMDKNCRLYGSSNHIWCFALHGWLDPVRLIQRKNNCAAPQAADWILRYYGLHTSRSYRQRYRELRLLADSRARNIGPSVYVVQALQSSLDTLDGYGLRQFDTDVIQTLDTVLEELDVLIAQGGTEQSVRSWFDDALQRVKSLMDDGGDK